MIENGGKASYKGGYMVVTQNESGTTRFHLSEIESVTLQTRQFYLSAYLLSELAKSKIPLIIPDDKRNPVAELLPLYGAHNTSKRVVEQLAWSEPSKKRVWQRIIQDKIANQASVLHSRAEEGWDVRLREIGLEVRSGDTTNREGHAARVYFRALFGDGFSRDLGNPTNAALDYGYSIILSEVNRQIVSRGYLTQLGICHRNEYNQFNLGCDFMEPFRPFIDKLVYDNVEDDFGKVERHLLVDSLNMSVPYRGGFYQLSSVISLYVEECLKALCKKIPVSEIHLVEIV